MTKEIFLVTIINGKYNDFDYRKAFKNHDAAYKQFEKLVKQYAPMEDIEMCKSDGYCNIDSDRCIDIRIINYEC